MYLSNKLFSTQTFSLLDILNFLFRIRYLISASIFIIYIVNAIHGLNIDYKGLSEIFDYLIEDGGFINSINRRFNLGMHYLGDIDNGIEGYKSSQSNTLFSVNNNSNDNYTNNNNSNDSNTSQGNSNNHENGNHNNGNENNTNQDSNNNNDIENNTNQNENLLPDRDKSPSPMQVDLPSYKQEIEGNCETSDDDDDDDSDTSSTSEDEKLPTEENGYNPEFSQREEDIENIKQERKFLRTNIEDAKGRINGILDDVYKKVDKNVVLDAIEKKKEVLNSEHLPEQKSGTKRTWRERDSDYDSDSDDDNNKKSRIISNPTDGKPQAVSSYLAKFKSAEDKEEFKEAMKEIQKLEAKAAKWQAEHDKLGLQKTNLVHNVAGKEKKLLSSMETLSTSDSFFKKDNSKNNDNNDNSNIK